MSTALTGSAWTGRRWTGIDSPPMDQYKRSPTTPPSSRTTRRCCNLIALGVCQTIRASITIDSLTTEMGSYYDIDAILTDAQVCLDAPATDQRHI